MGGAPTDLSVASVHVRSLLDCNLHPVPPTFGDPACSDSTGESTQALRGFNMCRPLMLDVSRHRQRHLEEVSAYLEDVGPWKLGTVSASSTLFLRTLPFAHMLLAASRGTHAALQQLPHSFMKLIMDLQAPIDGDVLRSSSGDGPVRSSSRGSATVDLDPNWGTALDDDPIE